METPLSLSELLALTGQEHPEDYEYDEVIVIAHQDNSIMWPDPNAIGAVGINRKEKRIVDIAVHPMFRRNGIASMLVKLSDCTVAFTVKPEAERFWAALGWLYKGDTIDKGVKVKVWVHPYRYEEP